MTLDLARPRWFRPTLEELRKEGLTILDSEYGPFDTFMGHLRKEQIAFDLAHPGWRDAVPVESPCCCEHSEVREPSDP